MTLSLKKIAAKYSQFFAVDEIAQSLRLQCVFAVVWFISIFDLMNVAKGPPFSRQGEMNCWSFWSQCSDVYTFKTFPESYGYSLWMTLIFALLAVTAWNAVQKKWVRAHFFLSLVIVWKFVLMFILLNSHKTNFELFHLIPSFVLLFTRNKLRGLKFTWALAYLFAARVKFDQSWILGDYFSSLSLGLPWMPDALIPLTTNAVIIFEIICSVGLFSNNKYLRNFSFWAWSAFHIYSVTIVGFYYPTRCMGFLWSIFGFPGLDKKTVEPPGKRFGFCTVVISMAIIAMNIVPAFLFEDMNSTFEGLDYGFFMINSNYQCQHNISEVNAQGQEVRQWNKASTSPMGRCYPQDVFQTIQRRCKAIPSTDHIVWTFWESRNGGPFYELVNEKDACHLEYKAFSHNVWLHFPRESKIIGYPEKNIMYERTGVSRAPVIHNQPIEANKGEESFLQRNYFNFKYFYTILWGCRFAFMIYVLFFGASQFIKNDDHQG